MHVQSQEAYALSNHASQRKGLRAGDRLGLRRPLIAVLACGVTLLGVSGCGGSSNPKTMTPAATAFLVGEAEDGGASAAQATQVVDCLDPALQAHGITTLSAAKSINADTQSNEPAWLSAASTKCEEQIVSSSIASGNGGAG
jgi:hypothetical protein